MTNLATLTQTLASQHDAPLKLPCATTSYRVQPSQPSGTPHAPSTTDHAWCATHHIQLRTITKGDVTLDVPDLVTLARHLWKQHFETADQPTLCAELRMILEDRLNPLWHHMLSAQLLDQTSRGPRTPPLAGLFAHTEIAHPFLSRVTSALYATVKLAALQVRQDRTARDGLDKKGLIDDAVQVTSFISPESLYLQEPDGMDLGAEQALANLARLIKRPRDASRTRAEHSLHEAQINRHQRATVIPDWLADQLPALRGPNGSREQVDPENVPQLTVLLDQLRTDKHHLAASLEDALDRAGELADPFVEYTLHNQTIFSERRHEDPTPTPFEPPAVQAFVLIHGKTLRDFPAQDRDRVWKKMQQVAHRALSTLTPRRILASTTPGFGLACLQAASNLNLPVFAVHHQADLITPEDAAFIRDVLAQARPTGRLTVQDHHEGAFLTWAARNAERIIALDEPGTRARTWSDQLPLGDALTCALIEADTTVPISNFWRSSPAR